MLIAESGKGGISPALRINHDGDKKIILQTAVNRLITRFRLVSLELIILPDING
jgi:hypothetical protein